MKLAFSTLGCPAWTLEQIVRAAVDYGYAGVEIRGLLEHVDLRQSPLLQPGQRTAVRRLFENAGVDICCLGASASFADSRRRRDSIDEARAYIEIASELGCPRVRVFGGHPGLDDTDADALNGVVEALTELAPFAQAYRVTLVLETHDAFSTGARVAEALRRVNHPSVGALWDFQHPFVHGETPAQTFAYLAPFLRHTHVRDIREGMLCLLGEGEIPVREMIALLKGLPEERSLYLSLESEKRWQPQVAEPEVVLPHYAATMRAYLGDAA